MTENILIEFTSDAAGLNTGVQALENMGKVDQKLVTTFTNTNNAIKERDKAIDKNITSLVKYTQKFKDVEKAAVGVFGTKVLKDFEVQTNKATTAILKTVASLDEVKKRALAATKDSPFEKLVNQVDAVNKGLLNTAARMEQLKKTGAVDTEGFRRLEQQLIQDQKQASLLNDQLGKVKNTISGTTRAMPSVVPPMAQKDAQKYAHELFSLTQVMREMPAFAYSAQTGLMAISNNLPMLADGFQKVKAETGSTKTALNVFVKGLVSFNSLLSIGVTLLTVYGAEIISAIGNMLGLTKATEDATQKQIDYNEALRDTDSRSQKIRSIIMQQRDELKVMRQKIELAKEQGASQVELNKLETQFAEQRAKLAKVPLTGEGGKIIIDEFKEAVKQSTNEVLSLSSELTTLNEKLISEGSKLSKKDKEGLEKSLKNLKTKYDYQVERLDTNLAIIKEFEESESDLLKSKAEEKRYLTEQDLKSATALAEAKVLAAEKGTAEELRLQKQALAAKLKEDLFNVNLTEGERLRIRNQYNETIADLDRNYAIRQLNNAKATIDAQLALATKGTQKELNLRIESLRLEKEAALREKGISNEQKLKLENEYLGKVYEMSLDYERQTLEDTINARIAFLNGKIATLEVRESGKINSKLLNAKMQLLAEQAMAERISVEYSINSAELRAAKIHEIDEKLAADRIKLQKDFDKADIEHSTTTRNIKRQQRIQQYQEELGDENTSRQRKKQLRNEIAYEERMMIEDKKTQLKQFYEADIITYEEYKQGILDLDRQLADRQLAIANEVIQRKQQMIEQAFNYVKQFLNAEFDAKKEKLREEDERNRELLDKKAISQDEYNKRQKKLKQQEAKIEKDKAIFDVFVDMYKQIFKIKAQAAVLAANPLTKPLAIQALAQIPYVILESGIAATLIAARKYKTGQVKIDGPGTETSDSIPAFLSKNESVINAAATRKYQPALEAINSMRFEEYITNLQMASVPNVSMTTVPQEYINTSTLTSSNSVEIDYQKLGAAVADHVGNLKDIPGVDVSIDENGIHVLVKKGINNTEFLNKKYNYKG